MYINILLIIPIISIISILLVSSYNESLLNTLSLFWSISLFSYFLFLLIIFNNSNSFQFSLLLKWVNKPNFLLEWGLIILSIDNISLLFVGLSIILFPICTLLSWNTVNTLNNEFLLCLNLTLLTLMGVFSVLDLLWFYILFEITLIPMFLIIGVWGGSEENVNAAFYFFFYTLVGSLLMLLSIFKIYSTFGTTNYQNLILIEIPPYLQYWLFLGFFISLSVNIPMYPVHIWLPQAHVEAPVAGSVLLAGILLNLGGYGFISFSYPLFPIASEYFTPIILTLSSISIIYGSATTCSQTDIKSLIAYSSIAHMGLVTVSIFVHSNEGLLASITMMLAHALVSSGLFMSSSILYTSHHSSAISYFKGLITTMPIFSSLTFILILSNIGFPLTFNFIAEFLSILSAFNYSYLMGVISCVGALLSTVYALYFYNSVYLGQLSPNLNFSSDLNLIEFQGFMPLIILIMILGVIPNLILNILLTGSYINISL